MAAIIAFRQAQRPQDWSNDELAELYRVVDILARTGVAVDTDKGHSDEGAPWFAFCRADTGEVIVHFARIDGQFVAVSAVTDEVVRGVNFRKVVETLVNRQPLILPAPAAGQKLFLHPAVLLTALVATTLAQMKSWEGQEVAAAGQTPEVSAAKPQESFADTVKSVVLDALNLVLRGGFMPGEVKQSQAELAQANSLNTQGLGLGNLSLASVVAFAISVIQGTALQDEDGAARLAVQSQEGDAAAKSAAIQAPVTPMAEQQIKAEASGQAALAEIKDQAAVKAPSHEAAVAVKAEKLVVADKSSMDSSAGSGAPPLKLAASSETASAESVQAKPAANEAPQQTAAKAEPMRLAAPGSLDTTVVIPAKEVSVQAPQHHFNFSEISKQAIEILFVSLADAGETEGRQIPLSAGGLGRNGAGGDLSAAPFRSASINASDIVFASGNPEALARLNVITDFVNSEASEIAGPVSFTDVLSAYWGGDRALTLVVYDSDDLPLNIFSFTGNVLFIEDSQVSGAGLANLDSSVQLHLANGGEVTLLGVINLTPLAEA